MLCVPNKAECLCRGAGQNSALLRLANPSVVKRRLPTQAVTRQELNRCCMILSVEHPSAKQDASDGNGMQPVLCCAVTAISHRSHKRS